MYGPINMQYIVASDSPPWNGINKENVEKSINAIRKANPRIISLSPHDSSDWSIQQFKNAYGDKYVDLKIGKEISI